MKLLTLDLATNVGFTTGPVSGPFRSGDYRIMGGGLGPFFHEFEEWLETMLPGIDVCAYETPILPKVTKIATVQKLSGLACFVECACDKLGIRVEPANNMQIKKYMGDGWMSKDQMFKTVKMFGHDPQSYDEADAIALRLYMIPRLDPKTAKRMNLDLGLLGASV